MPITNLNNAHLTAAQVTAAQDALTQLENALAVLTVTLTAEERSTYGSVNEQNKLLVNKVWDYRRNSPNLSAPDLDWDEFEKDYNSRQVMENLQHRLDALAERIKNAIFCTITTITKARWTIMPTPPTKPVRRHPVTRPR